MLLAKLRDGAASVTARMALEMATLGGAGCLGRTGELGTLTPGAVGDVAVWSLSGPAFAGAIADPVEAWLRCGPVAARHTVVARTGRRARRRARPTRTSTISSRHTADAAASHAGDDDPPAATPGGRDWCAHDPVRPGVSAVRVAAAVSLLAVLDVVLLGERGGATAPPFEDAGTTSLAGTPASTTAPPIESIAMVGDSITNGSKVELLDSWPTLGVESRRSTPRRRRTPHRSRRPATPGIEAVRALPPATRPDAVGDRRSAPTTSPVRSPRTTRRAIDELVAAIPDGAPLVWVDVYLATAPSSAMFNETLRAALAARGQSSVVEWADVADEDGVLRDGIHPSELRHRAVRRVGDGWRR